MFLPNLDITNETFIRDIVSQDYRTSSVFFKYNIDYCCGGNASLQTACEIRGLDVDSVRKELSNSVLPTNISRPINFKDWDTSFLIDYIKHVHHDYLWENLPQMESVLRRFFDGHKKKYTWLPELLDFYLSLQEELKPHLQQEEDVIFPYIKQIARAYKNRESYAALLVRTLRKPIEQIMQHEEEKLSQFLHRFRKLTNNYQPPADACISHKICFQKLKELDNDLSLHIHLENNILFPKAIAMEQEMLRGDI